MSTKQGLIFLWILQSYIETVKAALILVHFRNWASISLSTGEAGAQAVKLGRDKKKIIWGLS